MKTILVIEDQPDMRENIVTIVAMEGYAALEASDGRCGLELALAEKPDLILCDLMMPGMNGHEVLAAMRNLPTISGTPFIFLTARSEKQDLRQGMNLGADDYLIKPVPADELLAAIEARLLREARRTTSFLPDFRSADPLLSLGLTRREAEVLLWVAQGKSIPEIATILGAAENTVRVHLSHVFEKLGADNRHAAGLIALEKLAEGS